MNKPSIVKGAVIGGIVLIALVSAIAGITAAISGANQYDAMFQHATVTRVVDGDTFEAQLDDGTTNKVRMVNIDTPESVHPDGTRNTEAGEAASAHLKERLQPGTDVWLERLASDTDKYGRWLRMVWMVDPSEATDDVSILDSLNGELVGGGWAQVKDFPPDTKYSAPLHALEDGEPPVIFEFGLDTSGIDSALSAAGSAWSSATGGASGALKNGIEYNKNASSSSDGNASTDNGSDTASNENGYDYTYSQKLPSRIGL